MRTRRVSYVSAPILFALAACGSSSGNPGNDGDAAPSNGNDTGGAGPRDADGKTGHDASSQGGDSGSTGSTPEAGTSPKDSSSPIDVGTAVEAGSPGQVDITFHVTATEGARSISPYIYGVNDNTQVGNAHATLVRIGGNRLTAYNWENTSSTAGTEYN